MNEAESACIACALLNPEAAARVVARLDVPDFTDPTLAVLFRGIRWLIRKGEAISRVALVKACRANGAEVPTEVIGAFSGIFPVVADIDAYIMAVRTASVRLRYGASVARALTEAAEDDRDHLLPARIQTLTTELQQLGRSLEPERTPETVPDVVSRLLWERDNPGNAPKWGLTALVKELPPIRRGQFIVIGTLTSVGKSTFMAQQAIAQAREGRRVLWIGLEMSRDEILDMFCRLEIGVAPSAPSHWASHAPPGAAEAWAETFAELEVTIRDDLYDLPSIDSACRLAAMSSAPPDIIYVDYLQRVSVPGAVGDTARATAVSAGLKTLAGQTGIPVVTASQFNRTVQPGMEPQKEDLKDSSSIEQDANIVLIVWRPDRDASSSTNHTLSLRNAKSRGGPAGALVVLKWLADFGCIADDALETERQGWMRRQARTDDCHDWPDRVAALRIPGQGG